MPRTLQHMTVATPEVIVRAMRLPFEAGGGPYVPG